MCRFLVYKGREMLMSDLLTRADRSLILQSFKARERAEPLNGDGFGVGWYVPELDPVPGVFVSTSPAWSNRNLHRIADKVRSGCFFAHVRAASPGLFVDEANCHPFQRHQFLWMHNGAIAGFRRIRRRLRASLGDAAYDGIGGSTDSEHAFALFLDKLAPHIDDYEVDDLQAAMLATIRQLDDWTAETGAETPSRYNFAVTDGNSIVATRYVSPAGAPAHSLYYAIGESFDNVEGRYVMRPVRALPDAAIIASEPLTEDRSFWQTVPVNHMLAITPELHVRLTPIA